MSPAMRPEGMGRVRCDNPMHRPTHHLIALPTKLGTTNHYQKGEPLMRPTISFRQFSVMFGMVLLAALATHFFVRHAEAKDPPRNPTSLVIITNWGEDTCSLIDSEAGKELAKIAVGLKPYDIKVDPKGRFAYVTCSGANYISVIDIQAMLERKDQRIKVGEGPRDIELSEDGKHAVVANSGDDSISVVDIAAKKELYRVPVGSIPYGVDLTRQDRWAVITLWGGNKVVLVELGATSGKVLKTFNVGSLPYTVVVPDNSDYAIVSCFGSHQLHVIDLKRLETLPPVEVGRSPWGLSASVDGKNVISANFYSGDVSILSVGAPPQIDPADAATQGLQHHFIAPQTHHAGGHGASPPVIERARIPLAHTDPGEESFNTRPKNVAFTNDPNVAVLTDLGRNEVLVLDIAAKKILRRIAVGKAPYGVAFVPRN